MNRQEKETVIAELKKDFAGSTGLFLIGYRGMTVDQLQRLRGSLRKSQGFLKVAKVRLVKRAMEGLPGSDELSPLLKEQVAIVFAEKESPAIAKAIYDFSKEVGALKLVAGYLDEQVVSASVVTRIATLPSREVLLSQICCMLSAPMANCARAFAGLEHKLGQVDQ
jgi:large subunit ribosomal protein L10